MAHALVTGAAGFIGSTLTDRLLADGVRVTGVDAFTDYYDVSLKRRNVSGALAHRGFELLELDLGVADLTKLPEVDVVFHNAAQPGVRASWGREFSAYTQHNVLSTQRLLERYKQSKLERFIYASSSSVYGDAESYPTSEAMLPRPFSPYGVTKLAGEHLVLLYGRNFGTPVAALRYFTVYGDGHQSRDFTFVADAVEANVRAWQRAAPQGVYNVGGGSQVEVLEAIALLEKSLGRKARVNLEPRPAGDPLRTRADATRLAHDLGYATKVGIADGLAAQAEWARTLYGGVR